MSSQMYDDRTLGRLASAWMTDDVAGAADQAHLDQILSATGQIRPAPRWLALLKEPPMRIQTQQRIVAGSPARRPILVLAGIGLLILALVAAFVGAQLLQRPQTAADDWPMLRGDPAHAGLSVTGPVGRPVVTWRYQASGPVVKNIAIVGDLVYVPSDDGFLHAVDVATGRERWSAAIGIVEGGAGPAVVRDALFVVDADGRLRALDAASGAARWTSATAAVNPSQLTVAAEMAFVGSDSGELVAFSIADGAERWRTRISDTGRVNTPASDGASVYVGSDGGEYVALDTATGSIRWRVDTGPGVTGTAVVADGIAYIGGTSESDTGSLFAIDAASGQLRWRIDEPLFAPTVAGGVAYTTDRVGTVAAIDTATGQIVWRDSFQGATRPPAIAGTTLFVPIDGEQRIYALDAASGGVLWSFDVDGNNQCCLAIAKRSIFAGTITGSVLRISGDGAALTAAPPPTAAPTAAPSETPASTVPPIAEFVWRSAGPGEGFIPPGGISFDADGRIWAPDPLNSRFAIFERDGTFVEYWSASGDGQFNLRRDNGDGYGMVAFAPDGSFYVLDVGNRRVVHFNADREFISAWGEFGAGPGQYNDPIGIAVAADGSVYVVDDVRGVAEKYGPDGEVIGSVDVFSNTTPGFNKANGFALDDDGNLYVSQSGPDQVMKFSPSGEVLGTYGASGPGAFHGYAGPLAVDALGRVYVSTPPDSGTWPGILVFEADGTYIGGFGPRGSGDGMLLGATGILLDGDGNAFVLDAGDFNHEDFGSGSVQMFRLLPPLTP
jgi:outer membrane protein assembly factor BamB